MYGEHDHAGRRRLAAGAATLAIHAGLAALLIWGLAERGRPVKTDSALVTVALDPPKPPPPPTEPAPKQAAVRAAPAPEGVKGEAMPREAPRPALPFPMPPAATVAGDGSDANGGAGSQGTGTGAGGSGTGAGGGGGGLGGPAVRIAGALRDSDYPREAEAQGLSGTVGISFRVRTDGAIDRCSVTRSSGSELLDGLTCRLFTQRFRFRPATNGAGQPIDSTLSTSFTWGTRRRR